MSLHELTAIKSCWVTRQGLLYSPVRRWTLWKSLTGQRLIGMVCNPSLYCSGIKNCFNNRALQTLIYVINQKKFTRKTGASKMQTLISRSVAEKKGNKKFSKFHSHPHALTRVSKMTVCVFSKYVCRSVIYMGSTWTIAAQHQAMTSVGEKQRGKKRVNRDKHVYILVRNTLKNH